MATSTNFYPTRKAATAAAKPANARFVDKGSDAAKGKRWAVVTTTGAKSKKARAIALINKALEKDTPRTTVINSLVRRIELTPAGASTYYANVLNGTWG